MNRLITTFFLLSMLITLICVQGQPFAINFNNQQEQSWDYLNQEWVSVASYKTLQISTESGPESSVGQPTQKNGFASLENEPTDKPKANLRNRNPFKLGYKYSTADTLLNQKVTFGEPVQSFEVEQINAFQKLGYDSILDMSRWNGSDLYPPTIRLKF